jgi:hypothetical protein
MTLPRVAKASHAAKQASKKEISDSFGKRFRRGRLTRIKLPAAVCGHVIGRE